MTKPDNQFINVTDNSQTYELDDWLERNGFRETEDNRKELKLIINNDLKKGITSKNVKWEELDSHFEEHPENCNNLEQK